MGVPARHGGRQTGAGGSHQLRTRKTVAEAARQILEPQVSASLGGLGTYMITRGR